MGHIFRRNEYLPLLPKDNSLRAQKVLCHNKSLIYKLVSCLDATANSDYVKQKGSTKFLTLVKEVSLLKNSLKMFQYVQSQTQQHFIDKDGVIRSQGNKS